MQTKYWQKKCEIPEWSKRDQTQRFPSIDVFPLNTSFFEIKARSFFGASENRKIPPSLLKPQHTNSPANEKKKKKTSDDGTSVSFFLLLNLHNPHKSS